MSFRILGYGEIDFISDKIQTQNPYLKENDINYEDIYNHIFFEKIKTNISEFTNM